MWSLQMNPSNQSCQPHLFIIDESQFVEESRTYILQQVPRQGGWGIEKAEGEKVSSWFMGPMQDIRIL